MRFFAAPADQPRARRASDVVLLVPALLALIVAVVAYPPGGSELALERWLASLPGWLDPVWRFLMDLLWLWAALLIVIAVVERRLVVVAQALGSLVLAALLAAAAARVAVDSWPDLGAALDSAPDQPRFPVFWIAEAAAVIVTVSPHLVRPLRTGGRWILVLGLIGAAIAGGGTPVGALAAALVAFVVAAAIRLGSGTSIGRPGLPRVAAALAELGVAARDLEEADRQVAGVFALRARDHDGRPLLVKVYGRDAYDSQVVARVWRGLWYRSTLAAGVGRLQAAAHEGLMTLLASRAGVPTLDVVTAGITLDDDALLVLAGDARPLADDAPLADAWRVLERLGDNQIAHQQIDPATLVRVGGDVGLVDFGAAAVAPGSDHLTTDRAQLLATTACLVGVEAAIAAAVSAIGRDRVGELLPYLQTAAFRPPLRRALRAAEVDVDDLRAHAAATVAVEAPEPVRLRRVSVATVVQIALLAFASYTILGAAGDVDWSQVGTAVGDASWGWIALGLVVAQLPRVSQAVATLGSVTVSLPLGPVYAMQVAMGYMNVALPSGIARMAVSVRFFQRQGIVAATALTAGVIDSVATAVVQAVLLVLLLLFSEASLALEFSLPSGGSTRLFLILAGIVLATLLVVVLVPRIRRRIAGQLQRWWPDVRAALGALRASHKLSQLGLGNLVSELLFAIALGLMARSFGYDLPLTELLVITVSVWLLSGIVPVPGGIGVAELGLTVGLTAAGMTPETAVAAALLYRLATFYLPPLWGFFALQWLQRGRYL